MNQLVGAQLLVLSFVIVGTHGTGCNIQRDTIRLVGGLSDQGLVEICFMGQWESVCDLLWTDMKAEIACRELNLAYFGAQAVSGGGCSAFNMSTSEEGIFIQMCTGEERSITECHRAVQTNCTAAGVICSPPCDPASCNDRDTQCLSPTSTCYCPTSLDANCTCYEAICSPSCLNGGTCAAPGECQCPPGWTGHTCQQGICSHPCSNGGNCTGPDTCQCPDTWEGDHCLQAICNPLCSNGGTCIEPGTCQCPDTWEGDYCQQAVCNLCLNGGSCTMPDVCQCTDTWEGDHCQQAICDPPCINGGTCIEPGTCQCPDTSEGDDCQQGTEDSTDNIVLAVAVVVAVVLIATAGTVLGVMIAMKRRKKAALATHSTRSVNDKSSYEAEPLSSLQSSPAAHNSPNMQPLEATNQYITGQSEDTHNGQVETELNHSVAETPNDLGPGTNQHNYSMLALGMQQYEKLNYTSSARKPPGDNSDDAQIPSYGQPQLPIESEAKYDEPSVYRTNKSEKQTGAQYDDIQDFPKAKHENPSKLNCHKEPLHEYDVPLEPKGPHRSKPDEELHNNPLTIPPHVYGQPIEPQREHKILYSKPDELYRNPLTRPTNDEPHEPNEIVHHNSTEKQEQQNPLAADNRNYSEPYELKKAPTVEYAEPNQLKHSRLQNDVLVVRCDDSPVHRENTQDQQLPIYDKTMFAPKKQAASNISECDDKNYSEITKVEDPGFDQTSPKMIIATNTINDKGLEISAEYSTLMGEKRKLETSKNYSVLNWNDDPVPPVPPVQMDDQPTASTNNETSLHHHDPENIESATEVP